MQNLYGRILSLPLLARVPLRPVETAFAAYAAPSMKEAVIAAMRDGVSTVALVAASSSLSGALKDRDASDSAFNSAFRYVVRMSARCTPFGLFSAVGTVSVGRETSAALRTSSRMAHARLNRTTITKAVAAVELTPDLRENLILHVNDFVKRRGDMALTYSCSRNAPSIKRQLVESTPLIDAIKYFAAGGVSIGMLSAWIVESARLDAHLADKIIDTLLDSGVLVTDLWSSLSRFDDERVFAIWSRRSEEDRRKVDRVVRGLAAINSLPISEHSVESYQEAADAADDAFGVSTSPIQVDSRVVINGTIGEEIVGQACILAELMLRSSRSSGDSEAISAFMTAFEGEALVPFMDLCDSAVLDKMKAVHRIRDHDYTEDGHRRMMRAISDAIVTRTNVEFTVEEAMALFHERPASEFPESIEVGFEISGKDRESVNRGEYILMPSAFGVSVGAGRSSGRFLHMFGAQRAALQTWHDSRSDKSGPVRAEFSFNPNVSALGRVLASQRVLKHQIQIGINDVTDDCHRIGLDDLFVGVRDGRFFLWSRSLGRDIDLQRHDKLSLSHVGSDVLSLLGLIYTTKNKHSPWKFSLGDAESLSFVPRISAGNIVLSPARWILAADREGASEVANAIDTWLRVYAPPHLVRLVENTDQTFLLDLDTTNGRLQLREAYRRAARGKSRMLLIEEEIAARGAWLEGADGRYAAELIASAEINKSVHSTSTPAPVFREQFFGPKTRADGPDDGWLYFKIYCEQDIQDRVLTTIVEPLRQRVMERHSVRLWFFLRYGTPKPHIRLRMHVPQDIERAACAALMWKYLSQAYREGLVEDVDQGTYRPEFRRYGGPQGMRAAEHFFAADSWQVMRALLRRPSDDERLFVALKQAHGLLTTILVGSDFEAWLAHPHRSNKKLSKGEWDLVRRLKGELATIEHDTAPEQQAFLAARQLIELGFDSSDRGGRLQFADALLHMHANRFGLDAALERRTRNILWHLSKGMEQRRQALARQAVFA